MKKYISVLVALCMMFSVLGFTPDYKAENSSEIKKGDKKLLEAIGNAGDSPIPVAVFFSSIDYTEAENITKSRLKGKVSDEIIDIAFNGKMYTSLSQKTAKEQMEALVKTENAVIAEMTKESAQEQYNRVFVSDKPEIISSGTYTPNINMYMTSSQIYTADNSALVSQLRYVDPSVYAKQYAPIKVSKIPYFVEAPKSLTAGAVWTMKISDGSSAKWTSSDKKVATVSGGRITALDKGTAVIRAEFSTGIIISVKVNVTTAPKLQKSSITVKKGKSFNVKLYGKASAIKNTYKNTKYAKIISSTGSKTLKIKGLKKGTTTLKIKVNGVKTLSLKVKVN